MAAPGAELVYSYSESGDKWKEGGQFQYFDYDGQRNVAVAVSREGNTALSGEYISGTARVWVRKGSEWEQQAELTNPKGAGEEEFGSDVSLSASGSKALILAFGGEGVAAYEYTRTGSTWSQQGGEITMPIDSSGPQLLLHPRSGAVGRRTHRAAVVEVHHRARALYRHARAGDGCARRTGDHERDAQRDGEPGRRNTDVVSLRIRDLAGVRLGESLLAAPGRRWTRCRSRGPSAGCPRARPITSACR